MDEPLIQFRELILNRLKVRARASLSPEVLSRGQLDVYREQFADHIIVQLETEVLTNERSRKHYEITEPWRYTTWKDQLLHSLPPDSFRYRFVRELLGHDPEMRRTIHHITVTVLDTFPEAKGIPEYLGSPHLVIPIRDHSVYDYRPVTHED